MLNDVELNRLGEMLLQVKVPKLPKSPIQFGDIRSIKVKGVEPHHVLVLSDGKVALIHHDAGMVGEGDEPLLLETSWAEAWNVFYCPHRVLSEYALGNDPECAEWVERISGEEFSPFNPKSEIFKFRCREVQRGWEVVRAALR